MTCCGERLHAWDRFLVEEKWVPTDLRCFVVGESPGDADSAYFYDETRAVRVRTIILRELHSRGRTDAPTLAAFCAAGFLFDHGIRCHLSDDEVKAEARLAQSYASPRCAAADHLRPWIARAPAVWVMGYVARNAVSAVCAELPKDARKISQEPYPRQVPEAPRFFVSRYVTRAPRKQIAVIFERLDSFLNALANTRLERAGSAQTDQPERSPKKMSEFMPYDAGVLPSAPPPSAGGTISIRLDGLPPYKDEHFSIQNSQHEIHSRFVGLRQGAIQAMFGRAPYRGPVAIEFVMHAPECEKNRTLTDYMGGIMDTLDGSHGVEFTYLPVVYEDDCQVCNGRSQFLPSTVTFYEITIRFLSEPMNDEQ